MADDLKQLKKTVTEAVSILKIYVGNSAQVKNMNEKQREAINKWFDVGEKAEENIKKQRAFTERERDENGKFLKKREAMAFSFLGIASSIGGIFKGMAKGVGTAMGNMAKGITSHLSNFFSVVKGHVLGLFGEESEWFDILGSIKNSISGLFGWFTRGFVLLFRRTPKWASKMLDQLEEMFDFQVKQAKKSLLVGEGKKKKMGGWAILGSLILVGAALLAGWFRSKIMAIEGIFKFLRLDRILKGLKSRFPAITKGLKIFKTKFLVPFVNILKKIPGLSKLLGALKFGFKILGWPLMIILGIIDFIQGWRATNGDWQDKLIGGLKQVLHGLLDFPLEILGWAWDWLMNQFGIESSGTGDKLKKWADTIFELILEFGPFGVISDIIKGFTSDEGFTGVFQRKMDKFQGIFLTIIDFVIDIWNGFLQWAAEKASWIPGASGLIEKMQLDRPERSPKALEQDAAKYYTDHEAKKLGMQKDQADEVTEAVNEGTQATKDAARRTEGAATAIINSQNNQGGGGGSEAPREQIPDEVDNWGMTMFNYGGGMS